MDVCWEARGAEGMVGNSGQGATSRGRYGGPLTKREVTVYAVEKASVQIEMCTC